MAYSPNHTSTPYKGAIALCSRGELGLIMSDGPVPVTYNKCNNCYAAYASGADSDCTCERGIAWTGIHIGPEKLGQPWSSRAPVVLEPASNAFRRIQDHYLSTKQKVEYDGWGLH